MEKWIGNALRRKWSPVPSPGSRGLIGGKYAVGITAVREMEAAFSPALVLLNCSFVFSFKIIPEGVVDGVHGWTGYGYTLFAPFTTNVDAHAYTPTVLVFISHVHFKKFWRGTLYDWGE